MTMQNRSIDTFKICYDWYCGTILDSTDTQPYVCQTRDVFSARLNSSYEQLLKGGFSQADTALINAVMGEIGNNCFDHNLGQWRKYPGCWLQLEISNGEFVGMIADNGQGIFSSLAKADSKIATEQIAIETAFEKRLCRSGFKIRFF